MPPVVRPQVPARGVCCVCHEAYCSAVAWRRSVAGCSAWASACGVFKMRQASNKLVSNLAQVSLFVVLMLRVVSPKFLMLLRNRTSRPTIRPPPGARGQRAQP